jgi:hypothetical protein
MKRYATRVVVLLVFCFAFCFARRVSARDIYVYANGKAVDFAGVPPRVINNRVMVPVRGVAETLGVSVEWDAAERTVTLTKEDKVAILQIDGSSMKYGGETIEFDSPAIVIDSRTLIPVRAFEPAFDCSITWNDAENAVFILTNPEPIPTGDAPQSTEPPATAFTPTPTTSASPTTTTTFAPSRITTTTSAPSRTPTTTSASRITTTTSAPSRTTTTTSSVTPRTPTTTSAPSPTTTTTSASRTTTTTSAPPTDTPISGIAKADSYSVYSQNRVSLSFSRWKTVPISFLVGNADGTKTVVVAKDGKIGVQTYKEEGGTLKLTGNKTINYELPIFGGFLAAENNFYIAFGQTNETEDDGKETIKIVKYDLGFNKVSEIAITGAQIRSTIPFEAGKGAMALGGGVLTFHTTRERYKSTDGLNHQSQLTLLIDAANMTLLNPVGDFQDNHVSHSFDQYVITDGSERVLLDHGDAYPRAIVLHKSQGTGYAAVELFKIPGAVGANATGVSIGGFSQGPNNYLAVYNSINHSLATDYDSYKVGGVINEQRDVYAVFVPKSDLSETAVKNILIEKYTGTDKGASIPKLVKIEENKFAVLWEEFEIKNTRPGNSLGVKYLFIDDAGNKLTEPISIPEYVLSECEPVVSGQSIVWYSDFNNDRVFYKINL